jgi:hypothetical protein
MRRVWIKDRFYAAALQTPRLYRGASIVHASACTPLVFVNESYIRLHAESVYNIFSLCTASIEGASPYLAFRIGVPRLPYIVIKR